MIHSAFVSLKELLSHQPYIANLSSISYNNKKSEIQSASLTFLGLHSSLVAKVGLEPSHWSLYLSNWRGTMLCQYF